MKTKRVLIVGLFTDPGKNPVTQAGELARLLKQRGYEVLTVSSYRNRVLRIFHIILYISTNAGKFDVGIVQFYSGNSLVWQNIACGLIKWFNKKLVITIHGGAVPERMEKYPQRYLSVLKKADIITCPSSFIIDKLSSYNLKLHLIENTIPLENYPFFNKSELKPVLLWMRAFSDIYNPAMAVRVISELKQTYPDVKLFMGGPDLGALKDIQTLIKENNLQDNIEIVGFMDLDKKKHYAEKADIYISTNRVDNAPVTFIEMWAMGLPIVSTNVGGIPYLAEDGETALLVNDNDHLAMGNKLVELLSSKSIAQKLIQKGKQKSKDYGEDIVFGKWDNLLNAL